MRPVKKIHQAVRADLGELITYRALPTASIDHLDPFLFLNHHGPQDFPPHNDGLPFGPHPHRGFETLTFVIDGDVVHKDSSGGSDKISAGGVQWMTAGSGLIHSEVSSEEFMEKGGREDLLQLWMNLPAKHKMTAPQYQGYSYDDLSHFELDEGQVKVNLISGSWGEHQGPHNSITGLMMSSLELSQGGKLELIVPTERTIFFYVVSGRLSVNGESAERYQLVEFDNDGDTLTLSAEEDSIILFGHGEPFNEPIVAQGPFVMNSSEEIAQAYRDFRNGKMGSWKN